jgi:Uma2 family endonuclease
MVMPVTIHRFTVDEYHRMGDAGIFPPDARLELLDGEIVEMSPIGPRHAGCVNRLNTMLVRAVGERAVVTVQNPVILDAYGEPQPDLTVSRPRRDFYASAHPQPGDVLLMIEVVDSTGAYDRGRKVPAYARAGITELWLVDVGRRAVEVYTDPERGRYASMRVVAVADALAPRALPDVTLRVDAILG